MNQRSAINYRGSIIWEDVNVAKETDDPKQDRTRTKLKTKKRRKRKK